MNIQNIQNTEHSLKKLKFGTFSGGITNFLILHSPVPRNIL
jgi:hypothetical protein